MGKLMEKAGNAFGNEKLAQKGSEKRQAQGGYGDDSTSNNY